MFAAAQLNLLAAVEAMTGSPLKAAVDRLSFIREIDQILAEGHHLGLRYPARLLISAVALSLAGAPADESARRSWRDAPPIDVEAGEAIEQAFIRDLAKAPALLPGVLVGLERLREAGRLVTVVTEGSRERATRFIDALGLGHFVERVIEGAKTRSLYERLRRVGRYAGTTYMIGDQLSRDIEPAGAAGMTTIYIPGRFQPRWEQQASGLAADRSVDTFDAAVSVILESDLR